MSEAQKAWDDTPIGENSPVGHFTVTRDVVLNYSEAVEDDNPLHTNEVAARRSEWGTLIAQPTIAGIYVVASQQPEQKKRVKSGVVAKRYFEFHQPARVGDQLTTTGKVLDKYQKRGKNYVVVETVTVNQNGEKITTGRGHFIWLD